MFKRTLKVIELVILFCLFPLVFMYQVIELILVVPIYWIITGNDYLDIYAPVSLVWVDLIYGSRTFKGLSFRNEF